MGGITSMEDFVTMKIAYHRNEMQSLIAQSRLLVDIAVTEKKYDFSKIKKARDTLDKAIWHSEQIKHFETLAIKYKIIA